MFLCESKSTLFGLPNVDAIRNHWLRFVYNRTANPNVRICATHFMDDRFVNLGEYKAGCPYKKELQYIEVQLQQNCSTKQYNCSIIKHSHRFAVQ